MKKKKIKRKLNKKLTREAMKMKLVKFLERLEEPEIIAVFKRLANK